jgi:hypothetical protein
MYQLEAIPADELRTVAPLVLGTAFPPQLISGVLAYVARDTERLGNEPGVRAQL